MMETRRVRQSVNMLHSSWIQPTWCFKQGVTLKQPFIYSMTQFLNLPYAFIFQSLFQFSPQLWLQLSLLMKLWLVLLKSLQVLSLRVTGLWFWLFHLSFSNTQKKLLWIISIRTPQFFLLKRYSSWLLSDHFIIKGRHTKNAILHMQSRASFL